VITLISLLEAGHQSPMRLLLGSNARQRVKHNYVSMMDSNPHLHLKCNCPW